MNKKSIVEVPQYSEMSKVFSNISAQFGALSKLYNLPKDETSTKNLKANGKTADQVENNLNLQPKIVETNKKGITKTLIKPKLDAEAIKKTPTKQSTKLKADAEVTKKTPTKQSTKQKAEAEEKKIPIKEKQSLKQNGKKKPEALTYEATASPAKEEVGKSMEKTIEKPMSPFSRFEAKKKQKKILSYPHLTSKDISDKLRKKWDKLSIEKKKPFIAEYEKEKQEYDRLIKESINSTQINDSSDDSSSLSFSDDLSSFEHDSAEEAIKNLLVVQDDHTKEEPKIIQKPKAKKQRAK